MNAETLKNNKNQLVVNWHILERCNFRCNYCYAHWPEPEAGVHLPEVWKNPEWTDQVLSGLSRAPSFVAGDWTGAPRLNIAGGEPLLLWDKGPLPDILAKAGRLGFALSVITNGFLLEDAVVRELAPRLQVLGISMDSADPAINRHIGRCGTNAEQQIAPARVADIFRLAREVNPGIECKLNTVVCAANWREDFHSILAQIAPDRWKVFQMLPIADTPGIRAKQQPLVVKDEWFEEFKERHRDLAAMRPEDNDEMTGSYVMVDPFGRFYQNEPAAVGHRHLVSAPIHEAGAAAAWRELQALFHQEKFRGRYIPLQSAPVAPAAAL